MPVHDWTLLDAGVFHSFHTTWIGAINTALNDGLLPEGYYALAEQHAGEAIADVLTLHSNGQEWHRRGMPPPTGGTLVAEAPPRVRRHQSVELPPALYPRTIVVRHVTGHELVAMIEIVSPANKDRAKHVEAFATKAAEALKEGIHLLVLDLFPPGKFDPHGMHEVIHQRVTGKDQPYDLPAHEPLTLAAYAAGTRVDEYLEHLAVGASLIDMPLFLRPDRYINVPLEPTYMEAYRGVPGVWRKLLEQPRALK
jgi:hypothetical protein